MIRIRLDRSESLADYHKKEVTSTYLELPTTEGAWVQFTYEDLRDQAGGFVDLSCIDGVWWHKDEPWSDIVIMFEG